MINTNAEKIHAHTRSETYTHRPVSNVIFWLSIAFHKVQTSKVQVHLSLASCSEHFKKPSVLQRWRRGACCRASRWPGRRRQQQPAVRPPCPSPRRRCCRLVRPPELRSWPPTSCCSARPSSGPANDPSTLATSCRYSPISARNSRGRWCLLQVGFLAWITCCVCWMSGLTRVRWAMRIEMELLKLGFCCQIVKNYRSSNAKTWPIWLIFQKCQV